MSDTECGLPHEFEVVGVHVHTYNSSTQKTGPGLLQVSGQPRLQRKSPSQNKKRERRRKREG